jgi:hypothetical protein
MLVAVQHVTQHYILGEIIVIFTNVKSSNLEITIIDSSVFFNTGNKLLINIRIMAYLKFKYVVCKIKIAGL